MNTEPSCSPRLPLGRAYHFAHEPFYLVDTEPSRASRAFHWGAHITAHEPLYLVNKARVSFCNTPLFCVFVFFCAFHWGVHIASHEVLN